MVGLPHLKSEAHTLTSPPLSLYDMHTNSTQYKHMQIAGGQKGKSFFSSDLAGNNQITIISQMRILRPSTDALNIAVGRQEERQ